MPPTNDAGGRGGAGSPLLTDPPADGAGGNVGGVCLSEGLSPDSGGVTHGVGDGGEVAAIVAVGDPHGLAVTKAGSGGETHWVRL